MSENEKTIIDHELNKLVKMCVLSQGITSTSNPVMLIWSQIDYHYLN